MVVLLSLQQAPVRTQRDEPLLKLEYLTEHQEYGLGAEEVHLQVRVRAVDKAKKRSPVGLSAVVDTSGSMTGHRIETLKKTLKFLGSEMGRTGDAMGVIAFSDKPRELFQFQEINEDNLVRLYDSIDKIAADGRTDLSGGLEMGLDQIGASEDTSTACRTQEVFVFSDGEPNQGITKKKKILKLVDEKRFPDTRITTLPFGALANYELLQDIADLGIGEAYVIDREADIANAFGMAVTRLETTVAQNIKLTLTPLSGVRIKVVKDGYQVIKKGNSYRIRFPNLALQEDRIPYIALEVDPGRAGHQEILQVELSYEDTTSCQKVVEEGLIVSINRKDRPDQGANSTEVIENLCRVTMGEALLVKEGILDAATTKKVADEMEKISNTMQTQGCCQESKVIVDFIDGADMIARELRKSKKPTKLETAIYREIGDSLMKRTTSLPSVDTEDFHFLHFFDTELSKQKRKEATLAIVGGDGGTPQEPEEVPLTAFNNPPEEDDLSVEFPPFRGALGKL